MCGIVPQEAEAQVAHGWHIGGLDPQGLPGVAHGRLVVPLLEQGSCQVGLRDEIVTRHGQGAAEQGGAVLPVTCLHAGEPGQHDQYHGEPGKEHLPPVPHPARQVVHAPGQGHEDAHQVDVGVAVSHGLGSHLDDADDRHQGAQVPGPPHGQVWEPPERHEAGHAHCC